MRVTTGEQALELLKSLGASDHLVRHHALVLEAADELIGGLFSGATRGASPVDAELVRMGAAVHDAGKIVHPNEMTGPGNLHEQDGGPLLERAGAGHLSRFCETHARWRGRALPIEDLLVALADVVWKGRRCDELEERVVRALAETRGETFWAVYVGALEVFDSVRAYGPDRLGRSRG